MNIRIATPKDNSELLELSRETPMNASLVVGVDRSPDYFILANLQGEDAQVFVAEEQGKILGAVGCSFRSVLIEYQPLRIAYIGGIKIRHSARNGITAFRLMRAVSDFLLSSDARFGVILAMKRNQAMISLLSGRAGIPGFDLLKTFRVTYLIPFFRRSTSRNLEIRICRAEDLPDLRRLFIEFYRQFELNPFISESHFDRLLTQPGFSLENFIVAVRGGELIAALSFWDQSGFKRTVIEKYGGAAKTVRFLTSPFHLLPPEGEPIAEIAVRHVVFSEGCDFAVRDLVRFIVAKNRKKYRLFRFGFPDSQLVSSASRGFLRISIPVNLYAAFRKNDSEKDAMIRRLQDAPIWEDLSLH
ncbi:MAG: hypothetical protein COT43_02785 [Candidatus Marinimicrobia bacterium CG08_land_8_20_14_0_20_45_22]|nr:MAG: hypothetical protein COT43_02785 [Candidatus Marinimicrobia bacterium CG08_land_8_20_14_0_20_45_22]